MIFTRWSRITPGVLLGGGAAWLVKMVAIAVGSGAGEAFCWVLGLLLLGLGAIGLGLWWTQQQGRLLRILAGALGLVLFFALFASMAWLANGLVVPNSPAYWAAEAPVIGMALLALLIGGWLFTTRRRTGVTS